MRYGISTFTFLSPFTNESTSIFPKLKQWGFDAVEIPIEDPAHIDPHYVKAELDKAGLVCCAIAGAFGEGRDLRGSPEEQRGSMEYMKRVIDQMVILDCPKLIGPVYSRVGRIGGAEPDEYQRQWRLVVNNLREVADYAEKRGKIICVEPLNRFETDFINTAEQAVRLVKEVGSRALKILLDTFHMNIEEKSQAKAIRKAGRLLAHFHACGCDRGTPGQDHIDWQGIKEALLSIRYNGDIVIESFTPDAKIIARAAAIWRPLEKSPEVLACKGLKFLKGLFEGEKLK